MQECELLSTCGFFKKHESSHDFACRGFIKTYCKGDLLDSCKRKAYRNEHGVPPHEDMLPSGQMMPKQL